MIDQTDVDDIIYAATIQGIYDLTLGLPNKERRTLVARKAHEASTITFGEAREGAVEAHNFSLQASITTIHIRNEMKWDSAMVATAKTLVKSVFSIGTTTSKVTKDDMEDSEDKEDSEEEAPQSKDKKVAIKGMGTLSGKQRKRNALQDRRGGKNEG